MGQPPVGPQLDRQVLAVPDDVALDLGRVVAAEDPAEPTGDEGEDTRAEHPDEDEHPDDLEHEDTGARSGLRRQVMGCGHGAIVADRTGQPLEKIQNDTERDYFMSPQEALKYGLIDQVIDQTRESRGAEQ